MTSTHIYDEPIQLQNILEKIYQERGFDFRQYRSTTLIRRVTRRMRARNAQTYADYALVLDRDPNEYEILFNDLTINVTGFFRDNGAFQMLKHVVLSELIRARGLSNGDSVTSVKRKSQKPTLHQLRIWSAGCATGEEPYSIAMLVLDILGPEINQWDIAVLGTDIDPHALKKAKNGFFTAKSMEDVPNYLSKRYFLPEDEGYRVKPTLKRLVNFEKHDLTHDPYYHQMDVVVCRNVLIYFTFSLQTRVLKRFYEGLKKDGFLLLGKAEAPTGATTRLFHCIDKRTRLYRKTLLNAETGRSKNAKGKDNE